MKVVLRCEGTFHPDGVWRQRRCNNSASYIVFGTGAFGGDEAMCGHHLNKAVRRDPQVRRVPLSEVIR